MKDLRPPLSLALLPLPVEPTEEARALVSRWVTLPVGIEVRGKLVDVAHLSAAERRLLDDGDLIPDWAQYWLTLAQQIGELCHQRAQTAVMLIPGKSPQVLALTVGEVCAALGSSAFSYPCGVVLAWGVPPALLHKPRFPLPCAGAAAPSVDGLAAVLFTTQEDEALLASWR